MEEDKKYLGKDFVEVSVCCDNYRIVKQDGVLQMIWANFSPNRHNFTIENGIIINDYLG